MAEGRYNFTITLKEIIGLGLLVLAIGPTIFWVGRVTADIDAMKDYIRAHEAESTTYKMKIVEDHRVLTDLSENTHMLAKNQTEMIGILARLSTQVEDLRGRR